jgi:hypothetical protein
VHHSGLLSLLIAASGPGAAVDVDGMFEAAAGFGVLASTLARARLGLDATVESETFRGAFGLAATYGGPMATPSFDDPDALPGLTHLVTAGPSARVGAANEHGWGYFLVAGGYAYRHDLPRCFLECVSHVVQHGGAFTFGFGGMVPVAQRTWLGGELRIQHSFAPSLQLWTQIYLLEFSFALDFFRRHPQ